MIGAEKKLKRGLRDLSPLFGGAKDPAFIRPGVTPAYYESNPSAIDVVSVFSPDLSGDSLFLNAYVASHLAGEDMPCTILSLEPYCNFECPEKYDGGSVAQMRTEDIGPCVRRLVLPWTEFLGICERPQERVCGEPFLRQILFLDFEWSQIPQFVKVIPILQKWIILSQPNVDSLSEAYKVMKAGSRWNRGLRYYLLFEGESARTDGGFLFERFSEIVAKHLQIDLVWLGYMPLTVSDLERHWVSNLKERLVLDQKGDIVDNPGRIALARHLNSIFSPSVEKAS